MAQDKHTQHQSKPKLDLRSAYGSIPPCWACLICIPLPGGMVWELLHLC